jgi:hypothetical protein
MKASPKNDTTEDWSNEKDQAMRKNQRKREITYTLEKVSIDPFLILEKG